MTNPTLHTHRHPLSNRALGILALAWLLLATAAPVGAIVLALAHNGALAA